MGAQIAPASRAVPGPARHLPRRHFVVTHRDPVSVTASMVTMSPTRPGWVRTAWTPRAIGAYWADRLERMLRGPVSTSATSCPTSQTIDVRFDEFMADDLAMVRRIYEVAGQPVTDERRRRHAAFLAAAPPRPPRGGALRPGPVRDRPDPLAGRLAFYVDRFGVTREG